MVLMMIVWLCGASGVLEDLDKVTRSSSDGWLHFISRLDDLTCREDKEDFHWGMVKGLSGFRISNKGLEAVSEIDIRQ